MQTVNRNRLRVLIYKRTRRAFTVHQNVVNTQMLFFLVRLSERHAVVSGTEKISDDE